MDGWIETVDEFGPICFARTQVLCETLVTDHHKCY